jgi:hypothetical protein
MILDLLILLVFGEDRGMDQAVVRLIAEAQFNIR